MFDEAITVRDNDILLDIEVSPNSKKFQITSFNTWRNRFEVRIRQVPQKGKANKEIVKELSKFFNCDVAIFSGEKSSQKTVILKNYSKEQILEKIDSLGL